MATALELALAAGGLLVAGIAVAAVVGARQQALALDAIVQSVLEAPQQLVTTVTAADLPPPVATYLARAAPHSAPIRVARLTQSGTLRRNAHDERWMSFEATHVVAPMAGSFVWNARVSVAPLVHVKVRDSLVGGRGSGHVALMSAFPVGSDGGTMQMNSGSLHRFLAEAVWYPTALKPSEHLRWSPVDDRRALATLSTEGLEVSLEYRFGDDGEVTGIHTPGRWGSFEGGYEQVAWEGHFADYRDVDGFWIPMKGEVGWYVDGEWQSVWRGRLEDATFEF